VDGRERRIGVMVLAGIGGAGWLPAIVATVSRGIGGAATAVGATAFVVGVGAVVVGRTCWALITSRKVGAGLIAVGVVMVAVGVALLPAASAPRFGYFDAPANGRPASVGPTVADREP
jgi:hypothetical protein